MNKIIFSLTDHFLKNSIAKKLNLETGKFEKRNFPDGETYLRIDSDVKDKIVFLIENLACPDNKILALIFMLKTLKAAGAEKICLIAPYLPYMRQDRQFKQGEAISAIIFAELLSGYIDKFITMDPHLHRISSLDDIFTISTRTLHASSSIASWIRANVKSPLIIGPDEESRQWVKEIALQADADFVVAKKERYGDSEVKTLIPDLSDKNKTPVLIDDIISTGSSMCSVIRQLTAKKLLNSICIGVHALFDNTSYDRLMEAGASSVISCNTVPHFTNKIDIDSILMDCIFEER